MKIGIMGGTFDPIHNGHLMLGHAAYEAFSLDQIWFMPNGNPPHKKSETIKSTAEDRMKMTSLAIAPFPEFVLQPYEALRAEVSCSYQTMEHFSKYIRTMNSILSLVRTLLWQSRRGYIRNESFRHAQFLLPIAMR